MIFGHIAHTAAEHYPPAIAKAVAYLPEHRLYRPVCPGVMRILKPVMWYRFWIFTRNIKMSCALKYTAKISTCSSW
ncbi:Uncharacterised protein [Serratia fonticola]|uniref:Uncharacterized protein n=1 Tax=Serratia fonticola TaxID=47917 RepID=A0A4U9UQR3_SERFO|nr:Uncharacterised protein [Serratia fonticola]